VWKLSRCHTPTAGIDSFRWQGEAMAGIPDSSNFFCTVHTPKSREDVAGLFAALGWQIRKCSWRDYEVVCAWAELVIESESPILIHGSVAEILDRVEELVAPLRRALIGFAAECYGPDPERRLLLELKS
jgi:hypothetical protein